MRIAYPMFFGALAGVTLFLGFSACGSSNETPDGGGPKCEPKCADALFESFGDIGFADSGAADSAPTCSNVCAPLIHFKDGSCPDPGCVNSCIRQEQACTTASGTLAMQALLECEQKAQYSCSSTAPPLPVTSDCRPQAAAVMTACSTEAGTAEAGCTMTGTAQECQACCSGLHTEGSNTYGVALRTCACDTPGLCETACAGSYCMAMVPEAGTSCDKCLTFETAPDGGCASSLKSACGADPQCLAYEKCLTTYCSKL